MTSSAADLFQELYKQMAGEGTFDHHEAIKFIRERDTQLQDEARALALREAAEACRDGAVVSAKRGYSQHSDACHSCASRILALSPSHAEAMKQIIANAWADAVVEMLSLGWIPVWKVAEHDRQVTEKAYKEGFADGSRQAQPNR